jgi:hypothetical protein
VSRGSDPRLAGIPLLRLGLDKNYTDVKSEDSAPFGGNGVP